VDNLISLENITFIITTFRSNSTIFNCLNSIPPKIKKIIIENSQDENLKSTLEKKYENLRCFLMPENFGYGKGNNFGIKKSKTDFVFILNPDTILSLNFLENFLDKLKFEKFSIAAPLEENDKSDYYFKKNGIVDVEHVKGFAMFLNKQNMFQTFFDENFFLYLENDDLCKRLRDKNENIYVIPKSKINHLGGKAVSQKYSHQIELSRNWHWIWSKFYFQRKHKNYLTAIIDGFPIFFSAILKYIFYLIILNSKKRAIYLHRAMGYVNAAIGRKSFFRPNIKI